MERYHHPYHQHQQHQMMGGSVSVGGGGGEAVAFTGERFPQWSGAETKEFLEVRAELDRAFMETKRNKALWEVMATRLKEKGFNRSAEQCKSKWKNLVTRYKGCETMEPEAMRQQFPYYNEMHTIFSARLHQMLWAEEEGSGPGAATSGAPTRSTTGRKGKAIVTTSEQVSSDDDDDVEEREYDQYEDEYAEKRKHTGTRKGSGRRKKKKKVEGDEGDYEGEVAEVLQGFLREQEKTEARWREAYEAREEERRRREETWRKTMEALAEERRRMERSWREREEQRRVREEARAIKRDALITHLLNRLRRDDNI